MAGVDLFDPLLAELQREVAQHRQHADRLGAELEKRELAFCELRSALDVKQSRIAVLDQQLQEAGKREAQDANERAELKSQLARSAVDAAKNAAQLQQLVDSVGFRFLAALKQVPGIYSSYLSLKRLRQPATKLLGVKQRLPTDALER
jgi:hypothetical protein